MSKSLSRALFFALVCCPGIVSAQTPALKKVGSDTSVLKDSLQKTLRADSLAIAAKKKAAAMVSIPSQAISTATNQIDQKATRFFNAPGDAKKALKKITDSLANVRKLRSSLGLSTPDGSSLKTAVSADKTRAAFNSAANKASRSVFSKAKQFIKPDLGLKMTFEDAVRYQPVPSQGSLHQAKFVNVIGLNGTLNAFGVPINLSFSTDRSTSLPSSAPYNDLFKFDFDPNSLKESFKSDLQQYADVKNLYFGGKDISAFAKSKLDEKLYDKTSGFKAAIKNKDLTTFLNKPGNIQELLTMDRSAMMKKLQQQAGKAIPVTDPKKLANESLLKAALLNKQAAVASLKNNQGISNYFDDPAHIDEIRFMNKEQIAAQLVKLKGGDSLAYTSSASNGSLVLPDSLLSARMAGDSVLNGLAQEIFISSRTTGKVNIARQLNRMDAGFTQNLAGLGGMPDGTAPLTAAALSKFNSDIEIEKVAASLSEVKSELQDKGLDVNKMVEMQRFLNEGDFRSGASELGSRLMNRSAGGPVQQILGNLDALKLGAFSNHVPGATNDQELFLKGGSLTLRPGRIPITFGYGTVSDMSSGKDAAFQGSIFNEPRNVTFISTELRRPGAGNLKISAVSSVSRQIRNELYAIPVISNNNVALTISKGLNIGRMGMLDFEASKSSTLYANKYQSPALTALDAKNGARPDFMSDLYNSLAFGFSHRLELTDIGASDNLYFKYSGVGYQNPGNNGFGGARMKFGGSVRKSLYHNKVVFNLRSDMSNMPISYSSDDRWKTFNVQLDSRFTVNRSFNFNLRYANNGTDKRVEGLSSRVYSFQKFQVDGNANYKIGGKLSASHFSLGTQAVTTPAANATAGDGSRLLLFNYVQTLMMKKNVLSFNLLYNRELTPNHLIGNMLNSDISYQYTFFRKMVFSSGATFFDNSGIARQAGLKQGVQFMSAGHFDLGTYLDVRKNLVKPLYAELYPSCRGEFSLRYHLNAL